MDFVLNCNVAENTGEEVAKAIKHSLENSGDIVKIMLVEQCIDSSGGGNLEYLARELKTRCARKELLCGSS